MKKIFFLFVLAEICAFSQSKINFVPGDQRVVGTSLINGSNQVVGGTKINKAVALDLQSTRLVGLDQYGLNATIHCGNDTTGASDSTCTEIRVLLQSDVGYHIPIGYGSHILSPALGSNAGFRKLCAYCAESMFGSDSGAWGFHQIGLGKNEYDDTSRFNGIAIFKSAINFKGAVISASRKLTDSDYVDIFDNSGGIPRDTLPQISKSVGREYIFVQLSTGGAFPFRLFPFPGDKIDKNDSISLQSNLGRARMRILNNGSRWEILELYQEGIFTATGTGFAATAPADTGFWIQNGLQFFLRLKTLKGTSNAGTLGVTGLGAAFTISGLDTGYVATSTVLAYNAGVKSAAQCIMPLSGADITCSNVSSGYAAWTATGTKGLAYGAEFNYRLPKYPSF